MSLPGGKKRLDALVVERGLAESRARAQAIIQGGGVKVDGTVVSKPATSIGVDAAVELVSQPLPYVSRGGLKLAAALVRFNLQLEGKIALDVGASTGGFTDALLQAGVARVYAVDVGYGQLAWKLRTDPRVEVMERTNIRNVERLPEIVDVAVIDVSFISLRLVLPHVRPLLAGDGDAVLLIKPQFEAGREHVGRKGVIRSRAVWADVLYRVLAWGQENGWSVLGLERSPVRGPAGNVEFLAHLKPPPAEPSIDIEAAIERVISVDMP